MLKESGTVHCNCPNTGATNSSGFSGLPGGGRNPVGNFVDIGNSGDFWSSTESSTTNAWYRGLGFDGEKVWVSSYNKSVGISVRCVKD